MVLLEQHLKIYLQGSRTEVALLGRAGSRLISYVASLPILSDKVQFPSFLRTVASASLQADALVHLLLHFGWTWIGILAANNDLGLYSSQMLKKAAAQNEICIEFFETLPTQITKVSLARVIGIVQKSTAKVIVCYTYVVHITPILKEISLQGISSKMWIGVTTWFPSTVFSRRDLWETLNGTLGLAVYSAEILGFDEFFYKIHPLKDTADIFIRAFWEQVFNCKFVESFSEMKTENMTVGKALCTGTEKLQSLDSSVYEINYFRFPFSAYIAIYALAQALDDLLLCKYQDGPFANRSCADLKDFQPWQMLHYVKNVHITASSGSQFYFDTSGEFSALLDLLYWHMTSNETTKYVKVGTYNASAPVGFKLVIDESAIFWGGKHIQILSELKSLKISQDETNQKMESQLNSTCSNMQQLNSSIKEAEQRVSNLEDVCLHLEASVVKCQADLLDLQIRLDNAENRSFRSNVRFTGVPKGCENGQTVSDLITDFITQYVLSEPTDKHLDLSIMQAHRVPAVQSPNAKFPKTILVNFDDFRIKERILHQEIKSKVPLSVCSESCAVGYRKSAILGRPTCCFHCVPCPDGSIASQTDSIDCIKCPEDHWSNIKRDRCMPKEIDYLPYEDPLGFILALIAIFLFFNASCTLGIFIKYRQTPLVRANNLQLSYILLVSLMMCFLCSLIFIGRPKRVTCMLRQVIFGISFSFCVSCVMAKTITVLLAFKATRPNSSLRQWVGSRTSYIIVLSCSFIEFVIGMIWLGTSPPFPELNNSASNWKIIAECNEGSILMFYCILAFMGLLACVTFVIAFLARNLPDSFNEAKFITFSMLVFVSVWLSFIPAYLSTKGKYLVAVEIFAILSSGAGLLYCIFAPKIYIIFLRPELNTREYLVKKNVHHN
ncbi:extracellular calcium-sensing receptor-like [Pleurodeles waltl]|uniref:extracellular calcium-sensing receptor-like n=1 Tax=Pleurodeles waltl TaxID=8319 RepID=UPI0037095083